MKIGLVGGSYVERSLPVNAQRTVNLFPISSPDGKEVSALYGTPGMRLFCSTGSSAVRGMFYSTKGRFFAVSGGQLYEISSSGAVTARGSLSSSDGIVSFAENTTQLAICDGNDVYIFTYATNVLAVVGSKPWADAGVVAFIDGYFVVNEVGTQKFYISALQNGTSWNALDFASTEGNPDNLISIANSNGQLWLFGDITTELWTNTGAAGFPFQRISGGTLQVGCLAAQTPIEFNNSIYWVGRDKIGGASVYSARGFTPVKISTPVIDRILQEAPTPATMNAYAYQQEGHSFYIINGGGLNTSLCYDITTGLWHERAYMNQQGLYEQHIANQIVFGYNRLFAGDRVTGNIYEVRLDEYTDNGAWILRERTYTHIGDEQRRLQFNALTIGFEGGVGTQTGQGLNPKCRFSISKDGGRTWGNEYAQEIGKVGQTQREVTYRRLGVAEQFTFRVRISDPVKVAICGSYLS
jgi:Phage stabilisation protein